MEALGLAQDPEPISSKKELKPTAAIPSAHFHWAIQRTPSAYLKQKVIAEAVRGKSWNPVDMPWLDEVCCPRTGVIPFRRFPVQKEEETAPQLSQSKSERRRVTTREQSLESMAPDCPICDVQMVAHKTSQTGWFWGCTNMKCTWTKFENRRD